MKTIKIPSGPQRFAEDKDEAKKIRLNEILPALQKGENIALDFIDVEHATQSFIHALIGEAFKKHGEKTLENMEFMNCSPQLKSVIELVVDYSLGGFADPENE